jgi:hypothetical protein
VRWFPGSGRMTGSSEVTEPKCSADTPRHQLAEEFKITWQLVGEPGVKPGLQLRMLVLFDYTTRPLELAPESNPDLFVTSSCLRPREPD